jgi:spoIIIJ-associated protein
MRLREQLLILDKKKDRAMENLEITAKTVEEATKKALTQLNVGLDEVEITVLNEGRGGILGLGAEDARISVRLIKPEIGNVDESFIAAKDILEGLLSLMGMHVNIEVESCQMINEEGKSDATALNIVGDDAGDLIGRRGQTIDSIQYLVRLIASRKVKSKSPIMIDVQGYKRRHYEDLHTLALNVASQVKAQKTSIKLEPMPPIERRIIHMALANDPEVATESIGDGESRKVVVYPKSTK